MDQVLARDSFDRDEVTAPGFAAVSGYRIDFLARIGGPDVSARSEVIAAGIDDQDIALASRPLALDSHESPDYLEHQVIAAVL